MWTLRVIKISMVASIALFFSIVALNNIIDFNSNWLFVQHVLSMDTTFRASTLMARAITNSTIQKYIYYMLIFWETLTAIICWIGCVILLLKIKTSLHQFNASKKMAYIGLFFGFILYMVGFIIIGGEWFSMWQSSTWNGQTTAGLFIGLIMFVMIFLQQGEYE